MFIKNCTLRRTPAEDPIDLWHYNYGEQVKFGVLIVNNLNVIDEYNVNVELNLQYGYSIGIVDEAQVKVKQNYRFIWIPLTLTIGSNVIATINNDLSESRGVIKVIISRKTTQHKISDDLNLKDSFKSMIGKMTNKKQSDSHLIIYQNINIIQTLILKTKIINDFHLLILENNYIKSCIISKVKSEFETLFSHHLELLPTEKFSILLDSKKIHSDIIWINWTLDNTNPNNNLWSPIKIILKPPKKLHISCSNISINNGIAILDISIYNNTMQDMDVQLIMERNDSLVAIQDNYVVGPVKRRNKGGCRVEYIVVRPGDQQLPNIKLVDKLGNKSYLLSGVKFQF